MATYRKTRDLLLMVHSENFIDDEELLLLFDLNKSKNPEIPYSLYMKFDLDDLCDDEWFAEFRFLKHDIYKLFDVLHIPDEVTCPNRIKVAGVEALCVYLKRFAYPCR